MDAVFVGISKNASVANGVQSDNKSPSNVHEVGQIPSEDSTRSQVSSIITTKKGLVLLKKRQLWDEAVSYTHLTLPTIYSV